MTGEQDPNGTSKLDELRADEEALRIAAARAFNDRLGLRILQEARKKAGAGVTITPKMAIDAGRDLADDAYGSIEAFQRDPAAKRRADDAPLAAPPTGP